MTNNNSVLDNARYYKHGLVHHVLKSGKVIIKVPKDKFPEFHTKDHFMIEKHSLGILFKRGIKTPKDIRIIEKCSRFDDKSVLIEKYIGGIQKKKSTLTKKESLNIIKAMDKIHSITVKGYGYISTDRCGHFKSWREFLLKTINELKEYFSTGESKYRLCLQFLENINLEFLQYKEKGKFLTTDINPGNIFFNKDGSIKAIIDIDHPESGDPLFDYASIKWYNHRLYKHIKINDFHKIKKILTYEIIIALSTIMFRKKHELPTKKDLCRTIKLIENFEYNLISQSNISLLIIKPEVNKILKTIKKRLKSLGYKVVYDIQKEDFKKYLSFFYGDAYSASQIKHFVKAYENIDSRFHCLIIKYYRYNTIRKLTKDVGHYIRYQSIPDKSLRSEFGFPEKYNYTRKGFSVVFNAFHKIDNIEDFINHSKKLNLERFINFGNQSKT